MRNSSSKEFMELAQMAGFEVMPFKESFDLSDRTRFQKMELTSGQRMQLSGFAQQIPGVLTSGVLSNAYTVRFPEGLPHTLTALKQGGFGSMIRGEGGKFVGSASFFEMSKQAAVLNVFTALSAVTGQYFLSEINTRMDKMNQKIDKILEFLYSDKKAELLAELNFVKFAHQNFASIASHDVQRASTVIGLQEAQKVALKDIEFYIGDLDRTVSEKAKTYTELTELTNKAFRIHNCMELATQLFVTASLLEVYYSDNFDESYLKNTDEMVSMYIARCERCALSSFSVLLSKIDGFSSIGVKKLDKAPEQMRVQEMVDKLNTDEESALKKTMHSVLYAANQRTECYITEQGDIYRRLA